LKTSVKDIEKVSKKTRRKVCNLIVKGKCIYKKPNDELNYELFDLPSSKSGLKHLVVSKTVLSSGKVGFQNKMTTGHRHPGKEEVYIFLKGKGRIFVGKEVFMVKPGDIVTIPSGKWHRVVTNGKRLEFLSVFEKYGGRG